MEKKFTKGPWKFDDNEGCRKIKGWKNGRHKQAQYTEVAFTVGLADDAMDKANAQLIAAAPEILQALQEVVSDLFYQIEAKHGPKAASQYPSLLKAKAVIQKATT